MSILNLFIPAKPKQFVLLKSTNGYVFYMADYGEYLNCEVILRRNSEKRIKKAWRKAFWANPI